MAHYSIKDLERLSGIHAHTIRIWEKRYQLVKPERTNTNIRYYTDSDLKKILNVAVLNRNGIKISNIARLNDLELKEEIIRVTRITDAHDTIVDSMIISMIDLDEFKLEAIIDKSISKIGFKSTVTEVLYPFLDKVGIFWQSGDVNPAQEHFASNIIRQKILSYTDQLPGSFNPKAKRFILLLPEGEWHEIALLFAQYLLKEMNHQVIYLGQSVPYYDALATGSSTEFDGILVSCITTHSEFDFITYLRDLGGAFPDKKILYFSGFPDEMPAGLTDNYIHLHTIQDFVGFLSES